ncbi:NADH-quinone oxidoreductase subunit 5 family protein [Mucilaginibacter boryungensis]|uniref:NADH-quinone oxidoreductase subunit L n=1 Tax=Mucilaginibacter boryungensis TaxID=768480 RepID=A0ABR9XDU6_9SPHI|nr:NADH-quinone oxidoreductase subunit L [Mucilaginibacter boryungensis]MBE9665564.1 NADH-quinone oxidoreductase subunit L [Mucilaginibacter boryungensis]
MESLLAHQDLQLAGYTLTAVLAPLAAFLLNALVLDKGSKISGWVSTLAMLLSTACAVVVFSKVWNSGLYYHQQYLWFTIGSTRIYAGLLLNNLSVLLLLLVSVIALPVHIYGTAYMKGDPYFGRYFTYLSFFCFSMLALVVADNLVLVYAFWELVGFSSYLLIGFWNTRDRAVQANKKAFIMNRIGDIGLLAGIMILFAQFHTFDLDQLFGNNGMVMQAIVKNGVWFSPFGSMPVVWQYIACGGIILAVAAKSAQFPLHTWLPDAMEGPTSVSALIHAATMVAAGVFLLGRFYPFFNSNELTALAVIGCFTAFMAATIALTQNDLKRILAYSTISQLGFMVMAMGIGAYGSGLFHLVTHAFFKCLLFLSAGIIIHEMQHLKDEYQLDIDPQNILYMGGLRKKLPLTFVVCVIAALALVGIPFTTGYLSKDGILVQAFEWAGDKSWVYSIVPVLALLSGVLTAFYVARLIFRVFFGEFEQERINAQVKAHFTDGGWAYKFPLIFLALCCLFPVFSFNPFFYEHAWVLKGLVVTDHLGRINPYHTIIPVGVTLISILTIYWAYSIYVTQKRKLFPQHTFLFKLSYHEWYIDKFYNGAIVKGVLALSDRMFWFDKNVIDGLIHLLTKITLALSATAKWLDKYIVDGFLHGIAAVVVGISNFVRGFQTGKVQYYLFSMLAVILALFIFKILI